MIGSRILALVGLGAGLGFLDGPGCRHDRLAFQAHTFSQMSRAANSPGHTMLPGASCATFGNGWVLFRAWLSWDRPSQSGLQRDRAGQTCGHQTRSFM